MTLKYVGPKPLISHTGIEFDKNKEDKYVYLPIVAKLPVIRDVNCKRHCQLHELLQ